MGKKNLLEWQKAKDLKFSPSDCFECLHDPEFADELDAGVPQCESRGLCKHFGSCRHTAPKGNPLMYRDCAGLGRFEEISDRLILLSPFDGEKLPTIMAYPFMSGVVDMDEEYFQKLLSFKLSKLRESIISDRIRSMKNG